MPPLGTAKDTNAKPVFKARPVNKAVMESVGDLGVPRIIKKAPTTVKEFSFASRPPARKKEAQLDPVINQMARPLYSSFAKATPRTATPRAHAPSKPASTLKPKPKPPPSAREGPAEAEAPKAEASAAEAPAAAGEAPAKAEPALESLATAEPMAAEEEWVMVAEAARVPTGKRRIWSIDALPAYMASAEEEEEEADGDYEPATIRAAGGKGAGVSRRRVWGVDKLPQYMSTNANDDEDADDDADYAPTPRAHKKARAEAVEAVAAKAEAQLPSIADPSMAEYVELS